MNGVPHAKRKKINTLGLIPCWDGLGSSPSDPEFLRSTRKELVKRLINTLSVSMSYSTGRRESRLLRVATAALCRRTGGVGYI